MDIRQRSILEALWSSSSNWRPPGRRKKMKMKTLALLVTLLAPMIFFQSALGASNNIEDDTLTAPKSPVGAATSTTITTPFTTATSSPTTTPTSSSSSSAAASSTASTATATASSEATNTAKQEPRHPRILAVDPSGVPDDSLIHGGFGRRIVAGQEHQPRPAAIITQSKPFTKIQGPKELPTTEDGKPKDLDDQFAQESESGDSSLGTVVIRFISTVPPKPFTKTTTISTTTTAASTTTAKKELVRKRKLLRRKSSLISSSTSTTTTAATTTEAESKSAKSASEVLDKVRSRMRLKDTLLSRVQGRHRIARSTTPKPSASSTSSASVIRGSAAVRNDIRMLRRNRIRNRIESSSSSTTPSPTTAVSSTTKLSGQSRSTTEPFLFETTIEDTPVIKRSQETNKEVKTGGGSTSDVAIIRTRVTDPSVVAAREKKKDFSERRNVAADQKQQQQQPRQRVRSNVRTVKDESVPTTTERVESSSLKVRTAPSRSTTTASTTKSTTTTTSSTTKVPITTVTTIKTTTPTVSTTTSQPTTTTSTSAPTTTAATETAETTTTTTTESTTTTPKEPRLDSETTDGLRTKLLEAIRRKISKNRSTTTSTFSPQLLSRPRIELRPRGVPPPGRRVHHLPEDASPASNAVSPTERPTFYRPFPVSRPNNNNNINSRPPFQRNTPPIRRGNGDGNSPRIQFFVRVPGAKPGAKNAKIPNISHIQGKLKRLNAAISEGLASQQRLRVNLTNDASKNKSATNSDMFDATSRGNYLEMLRKKQQESDATSTTTESTTSSSSSSTTTTVATTTPTTTTVQPTTSPRLPQRTTTTLRTTTTTRRARIKTRGTTTTEATTTTTTRRPPPQIINHNKNEEVISIGPRPTEHPTSHFRPNNNISIADNSVTGNDNNNSDMVILHDVSGTTVYVVAVICLVPLAGIVAFLVRYVVKRRDMSGSGLESGSETGLNCQVGPPGDDDLLQIGGVRNKGVSSLLPGRGSNLLHHHQQQQQHQNLHNSLMDLEVESSSGSASQMDHAEISELFSGSSWHFSRDRLRLQTVLGEGNFGKVWKAEADNICGYDGTVLVAVKTAKEDAPQKEVTDLLQEMRIMQQIGPHPNVVAMLGVCIETEPYLLIMEYVMRGKLLQHLREQRSKQTSFFQFSQGDVELDEDGDVEGGDKGGESKTLTAKDLTKYAYGVAKGMEYIVSKGIIHRDLAARNILLDHKRVCKISDFGLSRNLGDTGSEMYEQKTKGALPIRWMAPESLYFSVFTPKSDVWSFGILMWEIVTLGSTPYPGMGAREVMRRVRDGYRLERPSHCHPELYKIISKCWSGDMNKRPDFSELRQELATLLEAQHGYIDLQNIPESKYYSMTQDSNEEEKL